DHAKNGVGANEVPGVNGLAVVERIAYEPIRIDGLYAAVDGRVASEASIELVLVEFVAFLIFGLSSVDDIHIAGPSRESIAGGNLRRRQNAIVSYVIERTYCSGAAAGHHCHQAGKGVGGPRRSRARVVHSGVAESSKMWTCLRCHAIFIINRVHAIDADE